jgi:hypothetical protein
MRQRGPDVDGKKHDVCDAAVEERAARPGRWMRARDAGTRARVSKAGRGMQCGRRAQAPGELSATQARSSGANKGRERVVTQPASNGQWWQSLLIWNDEEDKRTGSEGESWCQFHCASIVQMKERREERDT